MIDVSKLGIRLNQERKRLGLTQSTLADSLHVSLSSQRGYEAGARAPDAIYLGYALKLGININYVMTGSVNTEETINWKAHDEILLTIESWLEENKLELSFDKKMDLLRLFLSNYASTADINTNFIHQTLKLVG